MGVLQDLIEYRFEDPALLVEALTHPSLLYEKKAAVKRDNQRLEYLGDSVLQLLISDFLYQLFSDKDEGFLTKVRTRMVQTSTLARRARQLDLGSHLLLGRGEAANGGRNRDNILADAMEALVGAIYLDGGLEAARVFTLRCWKDELAELDGSPVEQNPKGQLQELLQDFGQAPTYTIVSSDGPDHARTFNAIVLWNGREIGRGTGNSKKTAQIAAAQAALDSEEMQKLLTQSNRDKPIGSKI